MTLGLISAMRGQGRDVRVFKKGPDYIDAAWLAAAAGSSCANLDTYMMTGETVTQLFSKKASGGDVAIIEGNRGLHDGVSARGSHSSAELAKLIKTPVLLVINATKATRTLAAVILGMQHLDPDVSFVGVVLNRVAGKRHVRVATQAIEEICGIPVLGAIPKLPAEHRIPGRHLGLVPVDEYQGLEESLAYAGQVIEKHLDLKALDERLSNLSTIPAASVEIADKPAASVRIGILKDGAFSFYYPENIEALERAGARLVTIRSMEDTQLPPIDALYIGGGFPETHIEHLVGNRSLRKAIGDAAKTGLPIYAECGGLMYLARSIHHDGRKYEMCGALPIDVRMHAKPQGHGYAELSVDRPNPFFDVGTQLVGHEFHYSGVEGKVADTACAVLRGAGVGAGRDGILHRNILALYTHLHACATPSWAKAIIRAAEKYSKIKEEPATGKKSMQMALTA